VSGGGDAAGGRLIDAFMPAYDEVERHHTTVRAEASRVWEAVRTLDLARSPLVRVLFGVRSLPGLLAGKWPPPRLGVTMDELLRGGFVLLAERPGDEIVLGLAGRFWRPTGGLTRVEPGEFRGFARPGLALAAWSFTLEDDGAGAVRLSTETRVRCTDDASRRAFRRYWRVVGPFSGLIRMEMLRTLRKAAEEPRR
jgi:hypothetical protein